MKTAELSFIINSNINIISNSNITKRREREQMKLELEEKNILKSIEKTKRNPASKLHQLSMDLSSKMIFIQNKKAKK